MKRLTINCISALRGGGQTNLINLMKYISQYKCKVILILNSNNINVFNKYKSEQTNIYEAKFASRSIFHRIYWEKFILPYKLKEWRTDIYYAPGGTMTTTVPNNCVSITTLQNMLPFDDIERRKFPFFSYIRFKLWMLKHILLKSFQKANKVVFVSRYSRDIVKSYISDIEKKSTMIPLAINNIFIDSKEMKKLPNSISRNKYYLYVSSLNYYKSHDNFHKVFSQDTLSRSELITDYLRMKYHLSEEFLYCPISKEKYLFEIDTMDLENPVFSIRTPLSKDYKERRFIIFSFESGDHGKIVDGNPSWAQ